ncbi:tRNA-specific 2-thiouridylase MnmA [Aquicella siphonis]|uniref:tRNA-specific 2-thiouridylase MnmA n=1 Tax=Aquicella siphonis TaxID=254247 RepID=A0A5E4PGJ5_9COXI|nr:tRNA 2-thiouridine(34) synthase MnmA [Aquicella siphonis]VVC76160.1 tRNA-specific 2-thiouridylase MnmA [Aquicella siphonis]
MNYSDIPSSRIIVGMSGGVDSSVAAYLLKNAGHLVEGVFMKNWEGDDTETYCPAATDIEDAQAVCDLLGIHLDIVNFADQYWERVFAHFLAEYRAGRTPNPDILCNREIKFRAFLDYARNRGADYIATGHYARALKDSSGMHLLKGKDTQKDQSYFLHALDESQLAQSLFPIGNLSKHQVRDLARQLGLKNYNKKDSTGICFIGERKFKTFLSEYLPARPGKITTPDGEELGRHDGLMFYTIGQRQGLLIGGKKGKTEAPWYVAEKDIQGNRLIVVQGENHPALFKQALITRSIHWINQTMPSFPLRTTAKTRYRQQDQACVIHCMHGHSQEKTDGACFRIEFEQPQRAVTPGQSIVFYDDDICLGGGIIEE